jgi:coenzyme F420-0:L-glutamate ligase/coenzyme F420-1:gamma-L-glutamate ligase
MHSPASTTITIRPLSGIGEVTRGCELGALLAEALAPVGPATGDVLVVTQKIVSKAEGRWVALATIDPGERARQIAGAIGKDPRLVELVLRQSSAVVRAAPGVLITRHRSGLVMANAGIDASNLGPGSSEEDDRVLLLPEDPDRSAAEIAATILSRLGLEMGVVISDSFGRPWRYGVVNVAIGCAGLPALVDRRGEPDRDGRPMQVTQVAVADLIASAAGLAMGEADEGLPAALVSGFRFADRHRPAAHLVRPEDEDLFR